MTMLRDEAPQCTKSNPYSLNIFFATVFAMMISENLIVNYAKDLFIEYMPKNKFPKGSKMRVDKAHMLGERVFKLFVYSITTSVLFLILK